MKSSTATIDEICFWLLFICCENYLSPLFFPKYFAVISLSDLKNFSATAASLSVRLAVSYTLLYCLVPATTAEC